jgi:hypothetical protein
MVIEDKKQIPWLKIGKDVALILDNFALTAGAVFAVLK